MASIGSTKRASGSRSIEALESRVVLSTIVVNTTADGLFQPGSGIVSLRTAIASANSASTQTTISFDPTVFHSAQTIKLSGTGLVLNGAQAIVITGPSAPLTIDGSALASVIQITGGTVSLSRLVLTDGSGGGGTGNPGLGGGGLYNAGAATLTDITVTGNTATYGGGIDNTGALTLARVTLANNTATYGGGLENSNGHAALVNVTISQNTAGDGAGIDNAATLTLTNCTVAGNSASVAGGGLYQRPGSTATPANSIVDHNLLAGTSNAGADASGSITSLGHNIVGETNGSTGWTAYDLAGTASKPLDPKLSPLGNFGGPTPTMPLLAGSPALNAGWDALAVDANGTPLTTDQRGLFRIYGPFVDIGACESQPPTLPGDVNHDGTVNLADLFLLTRNFGKSTPLYEAGDLDGDGTAGLSDFLILTRVFGTSSTPTTALPVSSASVDALVVFDVNRDPNLAIMTMRFCPPAHQPGAASSNRASPKPGLPFGVI